MTDQGPVPASAAAPTLAAERLAGTVLARIAAAPATEPAVARDLAPLMAVGSKADVWRIELGRLVAALIAGGLVQRDGELLAATSTGHAAAAEFLGTRRALPPRWETTRDTLLTARALALASPSQARLRALRKPDGLRAAIVTEHWRLPLKSTPTPTRVRTALAAKALSAAFGGSSETRPTRKPALSAKAARELAAGLSTSARTYGTDGRLVAALAAEALGQRRTDAASLRVALLRRYLHRPVDAGRRSQRGPAQTRLGRPRAQQAAERPGLPAAPPAAPLAPPAALGRAAPTGARPDPEAFAAAVQSAAARSAEGWSGNRRAFISKVWALIAADHPEWSLSEIEFKCMLAEAHRAGLVVLANADLKDRRALRELQDSAVVYKNTVWHYVRALD